MKKNILLFFLIKQKHLKNCFFNLKERKLKKIITKCVQTKVKISIWRNKEKKNPPIFQRNEDRKITPVQGLIGKKYSSPYKHTFSLHFPFFSTTLKDKYLLPLSHQRELFRANVKINTFLCLHSIAPNSSRKYVCTTLSNYTKNVLLAYQ